MLVVRAPLRVSFFGGGSDLPSYFMNAAYGLCVSTTINSFIYLAINKCTAPHIKACYSKLELVDDINKLQHDRIRECLRMYGLYSNIEIASFTDFTVAGSGLGASSSFTVALIKALHRLRYKEDIKDHELAELAAYIEISKCAEPIGYQDQFAAAYGGFKIYKFQPGHTEVKAVPIDIQTKTELENSLLYFNTGIARHAGEILKEQQKDEDHSLIMGNLVVMAEEALDLLENHELNKFGELLHESWMLKSRLPGVMNKEINEMYYTAIDAGALGGKILGAGGGGFLMMYVPQEAKMNVCKVMEYNGYERRDFKFYNYGTTIEYKR